MQQTIKYLIFVLLLQLLGGTIVRANSPNSDSNMESVINTAISPLVDINLPVKKRYVGIWVGLVSEDREFSRGFGETTLGNGSAPTESTFFEIGSISKTFTGILLSLSGYDLNKDVQDFFPNGLRLPRYNGSPVKLLHLVTHTSGLPSIGANVQSLEQFLNYSFTDASNFINEFTLKQVPGSSYIYSNLGFGLLANILEGGSSDDQTIHYETLIKNITTPLQMNETVVFLNSEQQVRFCESYDDNGNPHSQWNWGKDSLNAGAGAIKSTGSDMLKYLKANMGQIHSPIDSAIQQSHSELFRVSDNLSIAYGWHILKGPNNKVIWHNGATGGFQTFIGFNKEKNVGVILMANTAHRTETEPVDPRIDLAGFQILKNMK